MKKVELTEKEYRIIKTALRLRLESEEDNERSFPGTGFNIKELNSLVKKFW